MEVGGQQLNGVKLQPSVLFIWGNLHIMLASADPWQMLYLHGLGIVWRSHRWWCHTSQWENFSMTWLFGGGIDFVVLWCGRGCTVDRGCCERPGSNLPGVCVGRDVAVACYAADVGLLSAHS